MIKTLSVDNAFFAAIRNPHIKTFIELHIQDYVNAYNLDADKLEKEYLVNLGKGNSKRKKLIEDNQKKIDDPSLTEYEKQFYQYMNQILELLVNQKDNKLGLYLIAAYFNQKDPIKNAIVNAFYYNPLVKIALDDFSELMEYFSYSYFAKDKIINSLIILLYTLLVECEKCDKKEAIKFIKMVVNTNFKKIDIPTRIRSDYIENHSIYCAGVYEKLPIFQFYTGDKESYYNDEDIEKVQSFLNYFIAKKEMIPKFSQTDTINQSFEKSQQLTEDKQLILRLLNEFHKHYATHPNSYKQFLIEQAKEKLFSSLAKAIKKNPFFILKYLILTILTKLYTKLTTRNSSQKPS